MDRSRFGASHAIVIYCDTVLLAPYHCVPCARPHMVPGLHWLSSVVCHIFCFSLPLSPLNCLLSSSKDCKSAIYAISRALASCHVFPMMLKNHRKDSTQVHVIPYLDKLLPLLGGCIKPYDIIDITQVEPDLHYTVHIMLLATIP